MVVSFVRARKLFQRLVGTRGALRPVRTSDCYLFPITGQLWRGFAARLRSAPDLFVDGLGGIASALRRRRHRCHQNWIRREHGTRALAFERPLLRPVDGIGGAYAVRNPIRQGSGNCRSCRFLFCNSSQALFRGFAVSVFTVSALLRLDDVPWRRRRHWVLFATAAELSPIDGRSHDQSAQRRGPLSTWLNLPAPPST